MAQVVIGIGEFKISASGEDVLKTYALGSCVAVILYDKVNRIAGMVHVALPDSSISAERAGEQPAYFADTGLKLLVQQMFKNGSNRHNTWIKLVGGAKLMKAEDSFDIGKRNVLAVKKLLWKNNLGAVAEDLGGTVSRTVSVDVATGETLISSCGKARVL